MGLEVPAVGLHAKRIIALATAAQLPTMFAGNSFFWARRFPTGAAFFAAARRMAGIVDRILKGARPGDVPVEVVTQHKLSINLRVARELTVQRGRLVRQTCAAQAILSSMRRFYSQSMKREGFWHLGPVDELSADFVPACSARLQELLLGVRQQPGN